MQMTSTTMPSQHLDFSTCGAAIRMLLASIGLEAGLAETAEAVEVEAEEVGIASSCRASLGF